MNLLRTAVAALFLFVASPYALSCSCSNNVPVQKNLEGYRHRALFTAHTYRWLRTAAYNDQRISDKVLAVVQHRYWGLPWYWPSIVLIETSPFCSGILFVDKDYLVSGWVSSYGRIEVNECSRTQPLESAQIDLRTLDGSHCAGPGGGVLGHVFDWNEKGRYPIPDFPLTLFDHTGKKYALRTDPHGIYDEVHLIPGTYNIDSLAGENNYIDARHVEIEEGVCVDVPVLLRDYSVRGRALPGLDATAELLALHPGSDPPIRAPSIQPDGRFYFSNTPDGQYVLSLNIWEGSGSNQILFPGVSDRAKAARIQIKNHVLVDRQNLDFDPASLPMILIHVVFDPPLNSKKYSWRLETVRSNVTQSEVRGLSGEFSQIVGMRGASYELLLYGWSNKATEYDNCRSDSIPIVPKDGMAPVHISVPMSCR